MVFSLLTSKKSFSDPWIGNERLNRLGLHKGRMRMAAVSANLRRSQVWYRTTKWRKQFNRDGFIKIENFLPDEQFSRLQEEVQRIAAHTRATTPYSTRTTSGFGRPIKYDWGMDRFDGGTLNRFIACSKSTTPETFVFSHNKKLQSLCRTVVGLPLRPSNVRIYELVNGDEQTNHDIQKDFHRDTFFSSMKFWFFLNPVTDDDGPFMYIPGSHRLTPRRLDWEQQQAMKAFTGDGNARGGSFRISPEEIAAMGLPDPILMTAPANTLIMADTLGFHRRGNAKPSSNRLSIYSSNRPYPFFPFGI